MKAGEPRDFARHNVTPEDLRQIQQRWIESADTRAALATVERAAEEQARRDNPHAFPPKRPHAFPPKRPYAGVLPARLR